MATNLLPLGTAPGTVSDPFTLDETTPSATLVTDGTAVLNGGTTVFVEVQKADSSWRTFGGLNATGVTVVQATGTFRLRRGDTGASVGVDRG